MKGHFGALALAPALLPPKKAPDPEASYLALRPFLGSICMPTRIFSVSHNKE